MIGSSRLEQQRVVKIVAVGFQRPCKQPFKARRFFTTVLECLDLSMGSETRDTRNGMNAGGWARQRAAGGRRVCRRLARRGEVQTTKAAPRQTRRNHACEPLVASLTLRWAKRESVACTPVVATTSDAGRRPESSTSRPVPDLALAPRRVHL